MMNKDTAKHPIGLLNLQAYDINGVELWNTTEKNLIVNNAYNSIVKALAGVEVARITRIAIGTSGIEPIESDTEVTNPVFFDVKNIEFPNDTTVRFNFSLGYSDAVGVSIREFGLYTADERLFSRKVREPIEKTQFMSLVVAWEITF